MIAGTLGAAEPGRRIRSWVAGCGTGEDLWKYRDSTTVKCDAWGTVLRGGEGDFEWPVDLAGSQIDSLVVEGDALGAVSFELFWAAPGARFTEERSALPVAEDTDEREVRFELAGSETWKGEIRRFRLVWKGRPSETSRVLEVRVEKR